MALPAEFLEELRARTPLPALVGRRVRLARSGRQWKGCCPFHGEKTPSFYVYDDHYHCFGCGVHGDAISFVMQGQGLGFMEAVAGLAAEAGLDVPREAPRATEAEQRRHDLRSVLQAAGEAFARRLFLAEGARALAYLRSRGLTDETIRRFGLGWSGEGRGTLAAELAGEGIEAGQLVAAGLMQAPDDNRAPRELFFNRVMFPIRDARGRVVSFGGRVLGEGQPKYVNGPETPLFAKRRTLYGLDLARRTRNDLLVVEGYMDVIALHQAGFTGAVAPLGTALTAEHLETLWELAPEPMLCFDADAAGRRAALRSIELALPRLAPDRTLRVAELPEGQDPDTLARAEGEAGLRRRLGAARPLVAALYRFERAAAAVDTPEQRRRFRDRLATLAGSIGDQGLAREYRRDLLNRFYEEQRVVFTGVRGRKGSLIVTESHRSAAARADGDRQRYLLAILLGHPERLHEFEELLGNLDLPPHLTRVRDEMLRAMSDGNELDSAVDSPLDSAGLIAHLRLSGLGPELDRILSRAPLDLPAAANPEAMPIEVETAWWHYYGLLRRGELEDQLAAAAEAWKQRSDPAAERRLTALAAARNRIMQGELEADT